MSRCCTCTAVIGLTYRIGRHVPGVAEMVMDVLSAIACELREGQTKRRRPKSGNQEEEQEIEGVRGLLLLGSPGKGKTTLLRDVARRLADPRDRGGLGLRVIVVGGVARGAGVRWFMVDSWKQPPAVAWALAHAACHVVCWGLQFKFMYTLINGPIARAFMI